MMRELKELRAAHAKSKLEYNEMLAKAKQDVVSEAMAEMRAQFFHDLRSSQTAGSSTSSAGPLKLVVSTIAATKDSALHLPTYDAPRDP
jgi:hypothetical protein